MNPPKIKMQPLEALRPYERNARTHDDAQIAQLMTSIETFGFTNPVLVSPEGVIVAGHGRVEAAKRLGLEKVPTITVGADWTEEHLRAYILADNQLALNAGWDEELLALELRELTDLGVDLDLVGFSEDELAKLLEGVEIKPAEEEAYSRKIEAPIYEPRGDKPAPSELFDDAKTRALLEEIRAADLPEDVAAFLEKAAERHTVFDFRRIADFYAAAEPDVQRLMERSALVIIDFDQAIENGFVKLTKRLGDLASRSEPDAE